MRIVYELRMRRDEKMQLMSWIREGVWMKDDEDFNPISPIVLQLLSETKKRLNV